MGRLGKSTYSKDSGYIVRGGRLPSLHQRELHYMAGAVKFSVRNIINFVAQPPQGATLPFAELRRLDRFVGEVMERFPGYGR